MDLMKLFARTAPPLARLPNGCFTLDRTGRVLVGTVSSSFPAGTMRQIGRHVLDTFREAQAAQLPLAELVVHYGSLKIVARELRGGAIVFLSPKSLISPAK
ncbi:MAG: hypothetical protein MUF81_14330 [Verrucomicrobia bacterium]|jgi:hypothetical protein|nr:hypothetical protein [Verrucomicrobiota bacterium]